MKKNKKKKPGLKVEEVPLSLMMYSKLIAGAFLMGFGWWVGRSDIIPQKRLENEIDKLIGDPINEISQAIPEPISNVKESIENLGESAQFNINGSSINPISLTPAGSLLNAINFPAAFIASNTLFLILYGPFFLYRRKFIHPKLVKPINRCYEKAFRTILRSYFK